MDKGEGKKMGRERGEICLGNTDLRNWSALGLEEHNIPAGEARAKLIILWVTD